MLGPGPDHNRVSPRHKNENSLFHFEAHPLTSTQFGDFRTIHPALIHVDNSVCMPNLYFCQPHTQNQGMLRAVLSREDCQYLADPKLITYVGEQFPNVTAGPRDGRDFAVLKVAAEEADSQWRKGFYRVDADLMELNSVLLRLAR